MRISLYVLEHFIMNRYKKTSSEFPFENITILFAINQSVSKYMTLKSHDTSPHIQKMLIAGYRRMSPQHKLKRVNELTKAVQQLALARIRKQYGMLSEQELHLRLAALWLDRETMIRVFQWDPHREGY